MPQHATRSFTPAERTALRYVHEHEDEVATLDVRTLAQHAGTSTATFVRLAQKLGFSGFAEYRYSLRHTSQRGHAASEAASNPTISPTEELSTTARMLVPADVERAADALATAEVVILVGSGLSHTTMDYLHHYLFSASRPSICPPNQQSARDAIRGSDASSVVVCASLSGAGGTLELAREAHNRGMFVIGITCSLTSELITLCDICLFATAAMHVPGPDGADDAGSRLGILTAVDVLARTYAHRHPQGHVVEEEVRA